MPAEIRLNFIHPILMWILLGVSIYALYLGVQVRRTRTAGELKKELIRGIMSDTTKSVR